MGKKLYLFSAIAIALFVSSCGSSRQSTSSQPGSPVSTSIEQKFDAMVSTYSKWDKLSFPFRAEIKSPVSFSMSGRMYMVNNQEVHMSLKMLGMEVALLHLDADSIYLVDKFHKIAVIEPLPSLGDGTRVSIADVQDLLLGRVLTPANNAVLSSRSKGLKFLESTTEDSYSLNETLGKDGKCVLTFNVNETLNNLSSVVFNIDEKQPVKCDYSDWTDCEIGGLPKRIDASVTISSKPAGATMYYTPGSLTSGEKVSVPSFNRPGRGYRIIPASDLISTLKNIF